MSGTAGKVIKCRAAIMRAVNEPLSVEDIEVAPPKANEVRVKMVATGLCHSDLHVINGSIPTRLPIILGHEGAGIVESIGEGVTNVKPGDHVVPLFVAQCGNCKHCHNPKSNCCEKANIILGQGVLLDGTSRFTCKGEMINHSAGISTFSEYSVCPDVSVVKVNPKASLEKICLIGCGIPTGYGAALNTAKVCRKGSTCAVWGLGGIGLAAVMGCRKAGASRIIGVDINESKFELAKQFGCTEFVNPRAINKPIKEYFHEITDGGLDYSFECIGTTQTIRDAMESTIKDYGVSIIVGIAPFGQEVKFEPWDIVCGRTWRGSIYGGWKSASIPKLVELYLNKELMVDEFITHSMGINEINEGFELMKSGKSIRSTVVY